MAKAGCHRLFQLPRRADKQRALGAFHHYVTDLWRRSLQRRSQKDQMTWARMKKLADDWLPKPHIFIPGPSDRFAVKHPR